MATKEQKLKGITNHDFGLARQQKRLFIGIDPGVRTGVCAYKAGHIWVPFTGGIIESIMDVVEMHKSELQATGRGAVVIIEDARLRKKFNRGQEGLQGAGSVKRDSAIWCEAMVHFGIEFYRKAPAGTSNKIASDEGLFAKITGITHSASIHARCAAMIVHGL